VGVRALRELAGQQRVDRQIRPNAVLDDAERLTPSRLYAARSATRRDASFVMSITASIRARSSSSNAQREIRSTDLPAAPRPRAGGGDGVAKLGFGRLPLDSDQRAHTEEGAVVDVDDREPSTRTFFPPLHVACDPAGGEVVAPSRRHPSEAEDVGVVRERLEVGDETLLDRLEQNDVVGEWRRRAR
jgi:hypothetical protein